MKMINYTILLIALCCIGAPVYADVPAVFNYESVSLEDTLKRFYIIQRIDPFIHVITKIKSEFWIFPTPFFDYDKVHYDGVLFSNEYILSLIDVLKKEQSIVPILHTWAELKRYKYLHDSEMVKEFMQLIFIVTRYSLKHQCTVVLEDDLFAKNVYFLDAIEKLSLDQILDILDVLVEDLPAFIQRYELNSSMTWKQWLDKYWLVGPLAGTAFLIKVYIDYKQLQKVQTTKGFVDYASCEYLQSHNSLEQ